MSKNTRAAARAQAKQPRTVDEKPGEWRIEFDPSTRDYSAVMLRDERGYIGSRRTQQAARDLISDQY